MIASINFKKYDVILYLRLSPSYVYVYARFIVAVPMCTSVNLKGVARTLKKLRTPKGDYCIKQ